MRVELGCRYDEEGTPIFHKSLSQVHLTEKSTVESIYVCLVLMSLADSYKSKIPATSFCASDHTLFMNWFYVCITEGAGGADAHPHAL